MVVGVGRFSIDGRIPKSSVHFVRVGRAVYNQCAFSAGGGPTRVDAVCIKFWWWTHRVVAV